MGRSGERGSGISALAAQHDDDDDDNDDDDEIIRLIIDNQLKKREIEKL